MWPKVDDSYEGKTALISAAAAQSLPMHDPVFERHIIDKVVKPVHLATTGSALSSNPGAVNCRAKLCPEITGWLLGGRTGQWGCAGYVGGTCLHQHKCNAGVECGALRCYLEHPPEELRWILLCNKKQQHWVVAMSIDGAIHHDESEGTMAALSVGGEGCTPTDVWRASIRVVAYGRRKRITPADTKPTSAGLSKQSVSSA